MSDKLIKAIAAEGFLRAAIADTTGLVQFARDRHGLLPVAAASLGRLLTGALLMAADFKGDERLNITVDGDGPLGKLVADARYGRVRGYVHNPDVVLPANALGKIDVGGGVGQGTLYVIKDLLLKEPWQGSVPLVSGEIAEDLTYYLTHSEQIPSAVALGVVVTPEARVAVAGGLLIQVLPGCRQEVIGAVEEKLAGLGSITKALSQYSPREVLEYLLPSPTLFDPMEPVYFCDCSHQRLGGVLGLLEPDELQDLIDSPKDTELICHFCNQRHHFNRAQLEEILKKRDISKLG